MNPSHLARKSFVLVASMALATSIAAQPARVARHAFRQLDDLRTAVAVEFGSPSEPDPEVSERRARALRLLVDEHEGSAAVFGRAWSILRGGDGDHDAALRASCVLLALPEIADRDRIEAVHLTAHLPTAFDFDGTIDVAFDRIVGDERVEVARLEGRSLEELRAYKMSIPVPVDEFESGVAVEFALRVTLDGREPRPSDWSVRSRIVRHDGFVARAEETPALLDLEPERGRRWNDLLRTRDGAMADPWFRGRMISVAEGVDRVWHAEPGDALRDPISDLRQALEWGRALDAGEDIEVPSVAPGEVVRLLLPFSPGGDEDEVSTPQVGELTFESAGADARAIVVFVPGVPTTSRGLERPMSVRRTPAGRWHDRLRRQGFGPSGGDPFDLCVLESIGRVDRPTVFLDTVVDVLRTRNKPIVMVGEREGGRVVVRHLIACLAEEGRVANEDLRAIVLAGGGVPSIPQIEAFTGDAETTRRVLLLSSAHDQTGDLYRTLLERTDRAAFADGSDIPWSLVIDRRLDRIRALVDEVAPARSTVR